MVFIDGSNMIHSSQRFRKGFKIDYKKLVDCLVGNRQLIRPYFFGSYDPNNPVSNKFFDSLRLQGFDVTQRPTRDRQAGEKAYKIEKGVDVSLVTKMLSHAFRNNFDVAIIVSGDSDYVEAVQEVKNLGKRIEIAAFKASIGKDLKHIADLFIPIDDIASSIELTKEK